MSQNRTPNLGDLANMGRGLLMGGADIIPGVSGGTMALILGIYERLVTAISHFDLTLIQHLRARNWQSASDHIDLRFLITLGAGILLGVGGLASLMHHLLEHYALPTWSLLFGLIVASAWLVGKMVKRWTLGTIASVVGGAVFAFWLVGQLPAVPPEGYGYLFFCGMVAICAMILPGISGAFILVILGMYFHVTGVLKELAKLNITGENLATVAIFSLGCAVGLLSFSKLLRWLLNRHEPMTMALMCGILMGSLRKIWPFKHDLTVEQVKEMGFEADQLEKLQKYRLGPDYFPDALSGEVFTAIALAIVGFVLVVALDRLTGGHDHEPPLKEEDHEPENS